MNSMAVLSQKIKSAMLRSLRHYHRAQNQGHHTIDRLEEGGVGGEAFEGLPSEDENRPSSVVGTVSNAMFGETAHGQYKMRLYICNRVYCMCFGL